MGELTFYAFSITLAALLGGSLPFWKRIGVFSLHMALTCSAGILLGAAFFHMIPDAIELAGVTASPFILLGFLLLYFIEKFWMIHACEAQECEVHQAVGHFAFVGLAIHAVTEGVALGSSLSIPSLAPIIFLSIVIHKGPDAFSLSSLLMATQSSKGKILALNLIFALIVPIVAGFTTLVFPLIENRWIGILIAFSAGTFLHIAISDILPQIHKRAYSQIKILLVLSLGLGIMLLSALIK